MDIFLAAAAILVGLVVLEAGAERFTGAIAALARRLRAAEGTVGLLTAGGEWEELVVVLLAVVSGPTSSRSCSSSGTAGYVRPSRRTKTRKRWPKYQLYESWPRSYSASR